MRARKWIFGFLILLLSLPMINHVFGIVESGKLGGYVQIAPDTIFTLPNWLSGNYQHQKELYLNDNTGFRPDLVRLNNELDYLAFTKFHARSIIEGKSNYLFEEGYIKAYRGADYKGDSITRNQLAKLRYIQDTLQRAGKKLVMAFAPSKARFYPEYLPDGSTPGSITTYTAMKRMCAELGINSIDLNGWYLSIKAKETHPLFTKQGIHWSHYGTDLAADTFNKYLGKLLNKNIPGFRIKSTDCSFQPKPSDIDIGAGLNLIWPVTKEKFCYNQLEWDEDSTHTQKPDVIFIADSFFWLLMFEDIPQHAYRRWQSWFYFQDVWMGGSMNAPVTSKPRGAIDWMKEMEKCDAVVLLFTEQNLPNLGSGFIEAAYTKLGGK